MWNIPAWFSQINITIPSVSFTLQFLSNLGKVNLGYVYMPAEEHCLFKLPWLWVMTLNDYSNALSWVNCRDGASKQVCACLFEFSILYCHMSFACLQFILDDLSFPSTLFLARAWWVCSSLYCLYWELQFGSIKHAQWILKKIYHVYRPNETCFFP